MRLQHLALLPLGVSLRGEKTCLNKLSGWDAWDVSCKGYEGKGDVESHGTKAVFHLTLILRLTQGNGVNIEKYQKRRFGLFVLVLQQPETYRPRLKIMVSPVRVRVPPLLKHLQNIRLIRALATVLRLFDTSLTLAH